MAKPKDTKAVYLFLPDKDYKRIKKLCPKNQKITYFYYEVMQKGIDQLEKENAEN